MGFDDRQYARQVSFGPGATPRVIKVLLLVNVAVWVLQSLLLSFAGVSLSDVFGISHAGFAESLRLWQPFTYMFLHAPLGARDGLFHILFNMFILWMFGCDVARRLGPKTFLKLYLGAGVLAGLFYAGFALIDDYVQVPCVGASGCVMGVLVYAALLDPNRTVLFFFIIPMRLKTLVWILVGLDLLYFLSSQQAATGVAHTAHLGGALFGFLFFRYGHMVERLFVRMEVKAEQQKLRKESDMRAEVDRLLEKIHEEGLGSLTDREKRFLKRCSSRFEKKR
jgi:membrane associated rhomboid family serine protease